MTQRQFELLALALLIAYAILYVTARDPVCRIGGVSRSGIACAAPPPPPRLEPRPGRGLVV